MTAAIDKTVNTDYRMGLWSAHITKCADLHDRGMYYVGDVMWFTTPQFRNSACPPWVHATRGGLILRSVSPTILHFDLRSTFIVL